jgi:hypothetical protein
MPHYAYLATELRCPKCSTLVTDVVWFQWGFSPGHRLREEYLYHVGEPIKWRHCKDGSILSWAYFMDEQPTGGANIGDTAITNVIVRDVAQFWWEDPAKRRRCEHCGGPIEGAAIEIRDGVIQRAWVYRSGELDNQVEYFILQPDGGVKPMPEWNDHPMGIVNTC